MLYQNGGLPVPAGRAWAMFDALGLGAATSILNGGLPAWIRARGNTSRGIPNWPPTGQPRSGACAGVIVTRDYVKAHLGAANTVVVDAREPALYSGLLAEPGERAGHIPGALNIPYSDIGGWDGVIKTTGDLAAEFRAAGVRPGDDVIVYCHSGNKAGLVYLAARLLGFHAQLYLGSWRDWIH